MRSLVRATTVAFALSALTVVAAAAGAQAPLKLAYVNTDVIMRAAPGRDAVDSTLAKEAAGYDAQLKKMQDSINNLLTKYQKAEPTLSAAAKNAQEKAIQDLENDFQASNAKFQQEYQQHAAELMAPIQEAVRKVLDDIRAEDGYAMILDRTPGQQSSIVSADKNLDITDRVVARLRTVAATQTKPSTPVKPGAPASPAGVGKPPKPPAQ